LDSNKDLKQAVDDLSEKINGGETGSAALESDTELKSVEEEL
jgi:hypothetical protein